MPMSKDEILVKIPALNELLSRGGTKLSSAAPMSPAASSFAEVSEVDAQVIAMETTENVVKGKLYLSKAHAILSAMLAE